MNRNDIDWHGPMPAVTTPFDSSGAIDESAFADNVQRMIQDGATGIVAGGCTGEFWALSHAERVRLMYIAREAVAGKGTVIACTGAVTADETIRLNEAAKSAGIDGALVMPPYFVRLTDAEILSHFETVAAAATLPVMLYNIPGNAGNKLTPAIASRLADLDMVVAIKESSGDWNVFYETMLEVSNRLRVFCGPSSLFGVAAVQLGADGTVDCFPNLWSPGGLDLYFAPKRGDMSLAQEVQALGQRLTVLLTSEGRTLYPATKAAMDLLGLRGGGRPRQPLVALSRAQMDSLEAGLNALGLDSARTRAASVG